MPYKLLLLILIYNFNSIIPNRNGVNVSNLNSLGFWNNLTVYMKSQTWIFFSLCYSEDIPLAIFTIQFWWNLVFFELFLFLFPETGFLLCNSPGLIFHFKIYCWKHWNMEPSTQNRKQTINQENPICQWYFHKVVVALIFNLTRSNVSEKKSTKERHIQNCIH